MRALLAIVLLLGSAGEKRLSLRELHQLFPHGDNARVVREASFSTRRLGSGEHQFITYIERGHLAGLLLHNGHVLANLHDDELLANVQYARVIDVDGDGRKDVLVVFTYQQPALGTEGLAAQVLLQGARGRFAPAPQWTANVKRRLAKVAQADLRRLSADDVVEVYRETRRH